MLRLIITGTGRCGTGYMSTVLNKAGVKTSHERVFTPHGPQQVLDYEVCVSWLAVPYLDDFDCYKIGVWREKELVVRSFERRGSFRKSHIYRKFLNHHGSYSASQHWKDWNRKVINGVDEFYHISEMTAPTICRVLSKSGIEFDKQLVHKAVEDTPTNINS